MSMTRLLDLLTHPLDIRAGWEPSHLALCDNFNRLTFHGHPPSHATDRTRKIPSFLAAVFSPAPGGFLHPFLFQRSKRIVESILALTVFSADRRFFDHASIENDTTGSSDSTMQAVRYYDPPVELSNR
jgi:hypothetical protein